MIEDVGFSYDYFHIKHCRRAKLLNLQTSYTAAHDLLYIYPIQTTGFIMPAQEQVIYANNTAAERRHSEDRRRHSWRTVTYCGLQGRGRRHNARRSHHSYYLDHYEPRLVMTGLLVLLLSSLDALFTLTLLGKGAYEANHLMAALLNVGTLPFVITKVAVTAFGVLFLLMHSQFRILRVTNGQRMLEMLAGVYGLLIIWELYLLGTIA